jgi:ketosteroid isomerase-like protein
VTGLDKLEAARALFEAANVGEPPRELIADDVRIENASTAVTDAVYEGYEGVRQWRRDLIDVLEPGFRFELDDVIEAGNDRVVLFHRLTGVGKSSQAPMELRWASVCWFRDGKLAHAVGFNTKREALEAAGLTGGDS